MLYFVYSYVFGEEKLMAHQRLATLGSIMWRGVLAEELSYLKLCYFVIGKITNSPQISVDAKLIENTALYPKGQSCGN